MAKSKPRSASVTSVPAGETSELPPPPANPDVQQIALNVITPSLYQPRRFHIPDAQDPDLLKLARSIRAKGVIQPILLRPVESGFELVCGERRVRASRLNLPELDAIGAAPSYIPATIRVLSDTEAAELTVEENLRRKDLRPLEEADGVHTLLLLHKGDALAVASRLGQTPGWVACRARIHSNLSEPWKELLSEPENPMWFWTAAHVEEIAKLAQEVQDEMLSHFAEGVDLNITVPELRRFLADLTRTLGRAPFPLDDENLHPAAGACTNCPLTTLAAPLLFADQGDESPASLKDARCLNRNCWNEKCRRSADRAAAKLRTDHPDLLLVTPREVPVEEIPQTFQGERVLPHWAFDKVKKSADGAQPAMVAGGPQAGHLIWIKPKHPIRPAPRQEQTDHHPNPDSSNAPVSDLLAERRARHMNRRISRMADLTKDLLQACDGRNLSLPTLVALARVFGTIHNRKGAWSFDRSDPWQDFDAFLKLAPDDAAADVWTGQLQPVLASRLQYSGPDDAPRLHREIISALRLIGASYRDLFLSVANELPEPKAWAKIPGYEPEDLDADPPLPVLALDAKHDHVNQDDAELEARSA